MIDEKKLEEKAANFSEFNWYRSHGIFGLHLAFKAGALYGYSEAHREDAELLKQCERLLALFVDAYEKVHGMGHSADYGNCQGCDPLIGGRQVLAQLRKRGGG